MIESIDKKIVILLNHRDSEYVKGYPELRGWVCDTIGHCYYLECCILTNQKLNSYSSQFFSAQSTVNRHYRDWALDEVADIYNELIEMAKPYLGK